MSFQVHTSCSSFPTSPEHSDSEHVRKEEILKKPSAVTAAKIQDPKYISRSTPPEL